MRSAPITLNGRWPKIAGAALHQSVERVLMIASLSASTDDSASSSMRIGASRSSARAMAKRRTTKWISTGARQIYSCHMGCRRAAPWS